MKRTGERAKGLWRIVHLCKRPLLCLAGAMLLCQNLAAQADYIVYHRKITEISLLIFEGKEAEALQRFDSVYRAYDRMYIAHMYMGAQLAAKLGHEAYAYTYLHQLLELGVSRRVLWADSLISRLRPLNPQRWDSVFSAYEEIHARYLQRLKSAYAITVDSILEIDQRLTYRLNYPGWTLPFDWLRWNRQNRRHIRFLLPLIQAQGYPGERMVGLSVYQAEMDSCRQIRYGVNAFMQSRKMLVMLLHYFSRKRQDLNNVLLAQVKAGYMPVYDYGSVNDFLARAKRRYRSYVCSVWGPMPEKWNKYIHVNRAALGLCTLEQKRAYEQYWNQLVKARQEHTVVYLPALDY